MAIEDTAEHWQVVASATPFTGNKTGVRTDDVVMPDGSVAPARLPDPPRLGGDPRPGRTGPGRWCCASTATPYASKLWEIPAGLLDVPGENPLHAAQRELYEEAHIKAERWHVLSDVFTSPGGTDEAVRIFLAQDLSEADGERFEVAEEEADMELARVPLEELVRKVLAGELHNNCLVVGVLALSAALRGDGVKTLRPAEAPWPARPFEA